MSNAQAIQHAAPARRARPARAVDSVAQDALQHEGIAPGLQQGLRPAMHRPGRDAVRGGLDPMPELELPANRSGLGRWMAGGATVGIGMMMGGFAGMSIAGPAGALPGAAIGASAGLVGALAMSRTRRMWPAPTLGMLGATAQGATMAGMAITLQGGGPAAGMIAYGGLLGLVMGGMGALVGAAAGGVAYGMYKGGKALGKGAKWLYKRMRRSRQGEATHAM